MNERNTKIIWFKGNKLEKYKGHLLTRRMNKRTKRRSTTRMNEQNKHRDQMLPRNWKGEKNWHLLVLPKEMYNTVETQKSYATTDNGQEKHKGLLQSTRMEKKNVKVISYQR